MPENERIIVVGAGPVGLVAAVRLARAGLPVLLLERNEEIVEELRASTFHPPTLDMLETIGAAQPLIDQGLVTPTWQIRMHQTGERVEFDLGILKDDTAHPYRLQCEQHRLGRFLLAKLAEEPAAEIMMGAMVTSIAQDGAHATVTATRNGESVQFPGRYVIGADGAASVIRDTLGMELHGKTYPETTILATTPFPFHEHLEGLSNVNYIWHRDTTFSLLRLPDFWRVSLYALEGETVEEALEDAAIEAKLQQIVPRSERYEVLHKRPYRIHQRIVDDYRTGRVLLAGDAAHLNSPSGGMGMNGGVHDAFALSDALITVWRGEAGNDALDHYGRQRRPIAEEQILIQADRNRTRMQERDPERRRAELTALQAVAADPLRLRAYLLKSSMIEGLRTAATIG